MTFDWAVEYLTSKGIEDARYSASEIFQEIGGVKATDLVLGKAESDNEEVISAIIRRGEREPLQYIIGYTYFYRERYRVNKNCLIPRPDTEVLVEVAVKNIPAGESFMDLCSGSGCVGISTLKNTVGTQAVFADISSDAIEIAGENAKENGVFDRAKFCVMNLLETLPDGEFFAVLANPPYVTAEEYTTLSEEIHKEPKVAFVGGEDGSLFYKNLTPRLLPRIKKGGFIAYEIGYRQAELLRGIAKELLLECEIIKDLSGNDRVAVLRP